MIGFWIALIFAIIGGTIVLCVYLCLCAEEGVKMFEDPRCVERIKELELKVENLEDTVKALIEMKEVM